MRAAGRPILGHLAAIALLAGLPLVTLAAEPARELAITGTIVRVDLDRHQLTIEDPEGGKVRFEVPEEAEIVLDGEPGAVLEDLFEGDVVTSGVIKPTRAGRYYLVRAEVSSTE